MLYMVIPLIYELDVKFPILEKKRKDGLPNITPPSLVDTLKGFYLE